MAGPLIFHLLAGEYAIARLDSLAGVAAPEDVETLWSLSVTPDGPSLVCSVEAMPATVRQAEVGWSALAIANHLDLSVVGVCASVTSDLSNIGIPVLVIPSFAGLIVLMPSEYLTRAITSLRLAGHIIEDAPPMGAAAEVGADADEFTGWRDPADLVDLVPTELGAAVGSTEFTGWDTAAVAA